MKSNFCKKLKGVSAKKERSNILASLKKNKKSDHCVIVAPGRSAKNVKLLKNTQIDVATVSTAFKLDLAKGLEVAFHFEAPTHHPFDVDPIYNEYADDLKKSVKSIKTKFIFSFTACEQKYYQEYSERRSIMGIEDAHAILFNLCDAAPIDLKKAPRYKPFYYQPRTVGHIALEFMISMGYKKIYLVGFDQDRYLEILESKHLYAHEPLRSQLLANENLKNVVASEYFLNSAKTFRQFEIIKKVSELHGSEIINLNNKSWLNMFTKEGGNEIVSYW